MLDLEKSKKSIKKVLLEGGANDPNKIVADYNPHTCCSIACIIVMIANIALCWLINKYNKFTFAISIPAAIFFMWTCWGFLFGQKKAIVTLDKSSGQITINYNYTFTGARTETRDWKDLVDVVAIKHEKMMKVGAGANEIVYADIWLVFKDGGHLMFYGKGNKYEEYMDKIDKAVLGGKAKRDESQISKPCCDPGCAKRVLCALIFIAAWSISMWLFTKYVILTDD